MSQSIIASVNVSNNPTERGKLMNKDDMVTNAKKWQEREQQERRSRKLFVKNLINEYATYEMMGSYSYGLSLSLNKLARHDKRIFLSHLVDAEDYDYFCQNESRLEEALKEYALEMQRWIDEYCDEVWHENMQEAGKCLKQHSDNGEFYY